MNGREATGKALVQIAAAVILALTSVLTLLVVAMKGVFNSQADSFISDSSASSAGHLLSQICRPNWLTQWFCNLMPSPTDYELFSTDNIATFCVLITLIYAGMLVHSGKAKLIEIQRSSKSNEF